MQTQLQKNELKIKEKIRDKGKYEAEDIYQFTKENIDLLGFYTRDYWCDTGCTVELIWLEKVDTELIHNFIHISSISIHKSYTHNELWELLKRMDERIYFIKRAKNKPLS